MKQKYLPKQNSMDLVLCWPTTWGAWTIVWWTHSVTLPWGEKTDIHFHRWYQQLQRISWFGMAFSVHFPLSELGTSLDIQVQIFCMFPHFLWANMCCIPLVPGRHCNYGVFHHLWMKVCLLPHPSRVLSLEGKSLIKTTQQELSVPIMSLNFV